MKITLSNGTSVEVLDKNLQHKILEIIVGPVEVLPKKLGRPKGSINYKVHKKRFPNGRHPWTQEELDKMLQAHKENLANGVGIHKSTRLIRKMFGVSDKAIYSQLRKINKNTNVPIHIAGRDTSRVS